MEPGGLEDIHAAHKAVSVRIRHVRHSAAVSAARVASEVAAASEAVVTVIAGVHRHEAAVSALSARQKPK